jgi:hypothetical protein
MKGAIIATFIREKQYHKSASRVSLTKSLRECRGILDVFCYNKVNKKKQKGERKNEDCHYWIGGCGNFGSG